MLVRVRGQPALLSPKSAILVLPLSHEHPILCVINPRISCAEVIQEGNASLVPGSADNSTSYMGQTHVDMLGILSRRRPQDDTCILSTTAKSTYVARFARSTK